MFYNSDDLGNLWTADDGTGQAEAGAYLFTGFGAPLYTGSGAAGASPLKYGGANDCQTDGDTGLVLMGHRYYDTRIGRFISQDPIGYGDNWYEYAGNSPTNAIDPMGLDQAPPGIDQATWDQEADVRAENFAEQEDYLSDQFPDDAIEHDNDGFPYVQDGSMTVYAAENDGDDTSAEMAQSVDNLLMGEMATKAVEAGRDGNYVAAGAYTLAGAGMVYMTLDGGEGRVGAEGAFAAIKDIKGLKSYLNTSFLGKSKSMADGNQIYDIGRLMAQYGGKAKNWSKMKNFIPNSDPAKFSEIEIHWYENMSDGIGRVEFKSKLP